MDECGNCGRPRTSHHGILNKCPGPGYSYYDAKYDGDGNIDAEYKSVPVCPHCGLRIEDDWYEYFPRQEEDARITCPECDKVFDCQCQIEYSFTSTIPDLEAEARDKAEREAKKAAERREFEARLNNFPPGTRVKIVGDRGIYVGREGVIANKEVSPHYNLVDVDFDDGRQSCFYLRDLEVIDAGH